MSKQSIFDIQDIVDHIVAIGDLVHPHIRLINKTFSRVPKSKVHKLFKSLDLKYNPDDVDKINKTIADDSPLELAEYYYYNLKWYPMYKFYKHRFIQRIAISGVTNPSRNIEYYKQRHLIAFGSPGEYVGHIHHELFAIASYKYLKALLDSGWSKSDDSVIMPFILINLDKQVLSLIDGELHNIAPDKSSVIYIISKYPKLVTRDALIYYITHLGSDNIRPLIIYRDNLRLLKLYMAIIGITSLTYSAFNLVIVRGSTSIFRYFIRRQLKLFPQLVHDPSFNIGSINMRILMLQYRFNTYQDSITLNRPISVAEYWRYKLHHVNKIICKPSYPSLINSEMPVAIYNEILSRNQSTEKCLTELLCAKYRRELDHVYDILISHYVTIRQYADKN